MSLACQDGPDVAIEVCIQMSLPIILKAHCTQSHAPFDFLKEKSVLVS